MVTLRNSEFRSHSLGHSLQIVKQVSVDVLFPHDGDTLKNNPIHEQFLPPSCNIYQLLALCMIIWGMLPLQWSNTHTIQGCLSFFSPMPICISMQTYTLNMRKTRKPVFKAGRTCYIMLLLRRSLISSKRNAVLRFPATCHDSDMAISQGTEYAAWRLDLWRKTLFFEKATRKVIHSDTTSRTFFSSLSLILKFWCLVTFLQNLRWPENMEETS